MDLVILVRSPTIISSCAFGVDALGDDFTSLDPLAAAAAATTVAAGLPVVVVVGNCSFGVASALVALVAFGVCV